MIQKRLEWLRQRWKHRRMIAAINVLERLSLKELRDIADYAAELYKRRSRGEAQR